MKILMLAPHSVHSIRPLNWLLESGCEVVFVSSKDPKPEGDKGYQFVRHPFTRGTRIVRMLLGRKITSQLLHVRYSLWLRHLWRKFRPDVTHVHWVDETAYRCAKAGIRPLVLSVWGTDVNSLLPPNGDPEMRRTIGKGVAGADLVFVDAKDMVEKCAIVAGRHIRTELLPLGINTALFRPGYADEAREWRKRLGISQDAQVLLSQRAWEYKYGHHKILEAFARARVCFQRPGILVFKVYNQANYDPLGTGDYETELRRRVEEMHIGEWVRWVGEVPMKCLPELYAMADVVVNFPEFDAFPVTFMEAGACKRPVISCKLPSYEGTFAERYFSLVPAGDVDALARAMVELLNARAEVWEERISEAQQVVQDQYSESVTKKHMLASYNSLTHQSC